MIREKFIDRLRKKYQQGGMYNQNLPTPQMYDNGGFFSKDNNKLVSLGLKGIKAIPKVARFAGLGSKLLSPLSLMLGAKSATAGTVIDTKTGINKVTGEKEYTPIDFTNPLSGGAVPPGTEFTSGDMSSMNKYISSTLAPKINQTGGMYDQMQAYKNGGKKFNLGNLEMGFVDSQGAPISPAGSSISGDIQKIFTDRSGEGLTSSDTLYYNMPTGAIDYYDPESGDTSSLISSDAQEFPFGQRKANAPYLGTNKQMGGIALPGGQMNPIPGTDAIEFSGQTHNQGGIMMDPYTEVENGETMDQVNIAKKGGKRGSKKDYFFSSYLKTGGRSFADAHKDILASGGNQEDINMLAKMQEKAAGRNPKQVAKLGGIVKYQTGGSKPQLKDYKNSSEYMKALREWHKAQEQNPSEGRSEDLFNRAQDLFKNNPEITSVQDKMQLLIDNGFEQVDVELVYNYDLIENDNQLFQSIAEHPVQEVNRYSREKAAELYTVDPEDLVDSNNEIGWVPKEGAVSKNEDQAVWKNGQWVGNEDIELELETPTPPSPMIDENNNNIPDVVEGKGYSKEEAAKLYTVDPEDLVTDVNNELGWVPKEGAVSLEEDQAVWKDGQWTGDEEAIAEWQEPEPDPNKGVSPYAPGYEEPVPEMVDENNNGIPDYVEMPDQELTPIPKKDIELIPQIEESDQPIISELNIPESESTDRFEIAAKELLDLDISTPEDYEAAENQLFYNENTDTWEVKSDPTIEEEVITVDDPQKEKRDRTVPTEAWIGMGAGLLPAAYAFLRKQPAAEQVEFTPGFTSPVRSRDAKLPRLERYSYNQDIANVGAEVRGMNRYIETSGGGPANMINKMMAFSQGQKAKNQIRAAETRANIGVQNTEAQLRNQVTLDNLKRDQQANMLNAQLAFKESARRDQVETTNAAARQKRKDDMEYMKFAALGNLSQVVQQGMGDVLDYKADKSIAKELGSEGIYDRMLERLKKDGLV